MAVDWRFLEDLEGYHTKAKVPAQEDGTPAKKAGVTIGSGVDLGHQSEEGLAKMGVPKKTIKKLKLYLGKKGDEASNILKQNPLSLEDSEVRELTDKIHKGYLAKTRNWYNKNNTVGQDWSGIGLGSAKNFRKQVLSDDWEAAAKNLRNFQDPYPTRRVKELQYLTGVPYGNIDGKDGPETEAHFQQYMAQGAPKTPSQPYDTANPYAIAKQSLSEFNAEDFLKAIASYAQQNTNAPSAAPQSLSEGDTEIQPTESEEEAVGRMQEDSPQWTEDEESFINAVVEETNVATATSEDEDEASAEDSTTGESSNTWTPEEEDLIRFASGTVETEAPVYADTTAGEDSGRDPIYGIF